MQTVVLCFVLAKYWNSLSLNKCSSQLKLVVLIISIIAVCMPYLREEKEVPLGWLQFFSPTMTLHCHSAEVFKCTFIISSFIASLLFSVFLCFYQGINLTPCKHPEPSGSPEYWSSNAGCSITPTEFQKSWPHTSSVMPVCEQPPRIQGSTSNLRVSTPAPSCLVSILMFYTQNQVCGSTFDLLISSNRHRGSKH